MFARRVVRRDRHGGFAINLGADERGLLRVLPGQMREVLSEPDDPALRRLFPPAYASSEDRELEAEYRRLMSDDLLARHQEALAVLEKTADARTVSAEELEGWLRAINSIRLLLGTRLDVSEDDDPAGQTTPEHALYYFLGYLQECVLEALSDEE